MAERKKRGLGRGLGALIPDGATSDRDRPVDVFFSGNDAEDGKQEVEETKAPRATRTDPAASMQSSRRRKPKAGTGSGPSSAKTAEKTSEPAESTPAKPATAKSATTSKSSSSSKSSTSRSSQAAPTKKSSGSSAAKTNATQPAKSRSTASTSGGSKSTATKPSTAAVGSSGQKPAESANSQATKTTGATASKSPGAGSTKSKRAPSKTAASKSSSAKTADTQTPHSKVGSAESTTVETKDLVSSETQPVDAAQSANATDGRTLPEYASAYAIDDSQVVDATVGGAEMVGATDPDVEAPSMDSGTGLSEESAEAEDVSETHPGVYRSGREFFDEARDEVVPAQAETTDEVNHSPTTEEESDGSPSGDEHGQSSLQSDSDVAGVDSIPDTEFGEINVDLVDANPRQPRTFFDEDQLSELVHSIREIGVLQPVVVRQKPGVTDRFELIMGERRLRATKDAGLSTIPAIIRYVDDNDLLRDALLENLHRAELNPLEEAAAYGQLLEDFGCTQEELSERIGRSRPQISNTLRLLRLPPLVQRRVAAGVISAGHARAILGLRESEHMEILAQRIVAEGLSVRASEEAVVLLNRGDTMNVSRATPRVPPQFVEVAERLGDRLDTKVNITVGKKKGKLSVEFANQGDLDRILTLLGVVSTDE